MRRALQLDSLTSEGGLSRSRSPFYPDNELFYESSGSLKSTTSLRSVIAVANGPDELLPPLQNLYCFWDQWNLKLTYFANLRGKIITKIRSLSLVDSRG